MGERVTSGVTADASTPADRDHRLVETHTSVLIFTPDHVYKVKKALDFGFADFRDVEARRRVCEAEVALNRRLAPDIYLGVALMAGPDGELLHPAVLMRRLPEHARLSSRLAQRGEASAAVRAIARQLAAFHAACAKTDPAEATRLAGPDALLRLWESSLGPLGAASAVPSARPLLGHLNSRISLYLRTCRPLLVERIAQGRIRDGHGDLLADDVFILPDGPRILDCLEFDPALRHGDIVGDLAFLAMDLERLAAPDLARQLFDDYLEFSGETHPASLEHVYVSYRALVRAKVDAIRHDQAAAAGDQHAATLAARSAILHLRQACRHLDQATPRVVMVGGLPGTGKSSVSEQIAERMEMAVLASDVIRRQSTGADMATPRPAAYGSGHYDAATTDAVYGELLSRTVNAVAHGVSVVVDASWASAGRRAQMAAAVTDCGAELVQMECRVPAEIALRRLAARDGRAGWSDADSMIHDRMAQDWTEWTEAAALDTTGSLEGTVERALTLVRRTDFAPEPSAAPGG